MRKKELLDGLYWARRIQVLERQQKELEQRMKSLEDRNRQQAVTCEMGPVTLSSKDADAFAARVEQAVLNALARGRMPFQGDSNGT